MIHLVVMFILFFTDLLLFKKDQVCQKTGKIHRLIFHEFKQSHKGTEANYNMHATFSRKPVNKKNVDVGM